ncbi:MAG TPA: hypothetical protein VLL77_01405 [Anaerolineales bacterium]|nr:hypothetical protein [Anaerolineales bacterium]
MIQIVWQYKVKAEARERFELAYGPGGAWSNLFAKSQGYRGTVLLRETRESLRYLTIDSWDSETERNAMLVEHQAEYAALDTAFREWTDSESAVGVFRMLAEASVRPRKETRRGGRPTLGKKRRPKA